LSKLIPFFPEIVKRQRPAKPIITPNIFRLLIFNLKKSNPITTTQIGVSELSIPARELSIFFAMAPANK